jgi:protein gp37
MGKSPIEWVRDAEDGSYGQTWPIVNGCRRISPGCGGASGVGGCYAERLISTRLSKTKKYGGLAVFGKNGPRWTGESRLWLPDLAMPLKLRKPSRIFVADMGDLFFEPVTNEEIAAIYGVMSASRRHTFLVLTKRAERLPEWYAWIERRAKEEGVAIAEMCREYAETLLRSSDDERAGDYSDQLRIQGLADRNAWPLPNLHVGVSVESQKYADERIPELFRIPAAVRYLSVEPQLEDVTLAHYLAIPDGLDDDPHAAFLMHEAIRNGTGDSIRKLSWVIQGGESGPGARPFHYEWADKTRRECKDAGVAYFFKQAGARPHAKNELVQLRSKKGSDLDELPRKLRVREYPSP